MENKMCTKCKEIKTLDQFSKAKDTKDGLKTGCKLCVKKYNKSYNKDPKNIPKLKEYNKKYKKEWDLLNPEWNIQYNLDNKEWRKNYNKEWNFNNKDKVNAYISERYKNDPLFKVKVLIKSSIYQSFKSKRFNKTGKTVDILGCTFNELRNHIESLWEPWMNWDNHGLYNGELNYGWDIDHIIPLSSAKTIEEITKLNYYSNLQPLCSKINRDIKKSKLNYKNGETEKTEI